MTLDPLHLSDLAVEGHEPVAVTAEPVAVPYRFMAPNATSIRVTCSCGQMIARSVDVAYGVINDHRAIAVASAAYQSHVLAATGAGGISSELLGAIQTLRGQFCVPPGSKEFMLLSGRERIVECILEYDRLV